MVVVSSTVFNILSITPQASAILLSWVMPLGFTGVVQGTAGAGNGSYSSNFTDVSSPFYAPGNGCHDQYLPRYRRPDQFALVVLSNMTGAVGGWLPPKLEPRRRPTVLDGGRFVLSLPSYWRFNAIRTMVRETPSQPSGLRRLLLAPFMSMFFVVRILVKGIAIVCIPITLVVSKVIRKRCPHCQRKGLHWKRVGPEPALTGDTRPFGAGMCDYCHHQFWKVDGRAMVHITPADPRYIQDTDEPPPRVV
ncbi:MAG: hypothetical protein ABSD58_11105 [Verrucomicrobiia bacterium]